MPYKVKKILLPSIIIVYILVVFFPVIFPDYFRYEWTTVIVLLFFGIILWTRAGYIKYKLKKEGKLPYTKEELFIKGNFYLERNRDSKALEWYEQAANLGHTGAMVKIGEIYIIRKDYNEAIEWLQKSAMAGDVYSKSLIKTLKNYTYNSEYNVDNISEKLFKAYESRDDFGNNKNKRSVSQLSNLLKVGILDFADAWLIWNTNDTSNPIYQFRMVFIIIWIGQTIILIVCSAYFFLSNTSIELKSWNKITFRHNIIYIIFVTCFIIAILLGSFLGVFKLIVFR